MSENKVFGLFMTLMICITIIIGGAIGHSLMTTSYTKELIESSLQKGQNPLYVKCAMESNPSAECRFLITALSLNGQSKDTTPIQEKQEKSTKK